MSKGQIALMPAYVLHQRPFQESSLLVDFYTQDSGIVRAVAKGAKGKNGVGKLLQPFMPLLVSYYGKGELYTLKTVEQTKAMPMLTGKKLLVALYLNELILRLLRPADAAPNLFFMYQDTLERLFTEPLACVLRRFEKRLLEHLGYGIDFGYDSERCAIISNKYYSFNPGHGWQMTLDASSNILGATILAIGNEEWDKPSLAAAKTIFASALRLYLGGREIMSKQLWL